MRTPHRVRLHRHRAPRCRRRDAGLLQHIADHPHGERMRRAMIGLQVRRHVDEHLVDRIDMDILGGNIAQVDLIDARADLHIPPHLRHGDNIFHCVFRMLRKLIGKAGAACQRMPRGAVLPAQVLLLDHLHNLKQPRPPRYADRLQSGRNRKADRLLCAALIRDDQIRIQRIQPARNTFNRSIIALQINTDILRHPAHSSHERTLVS